MPRVRCAQGVLLARVHCAEDTLLPRVPCKAPCAVGRAINCFINSAHLMHHAYVGMLVHSKVSSLCVYDWTFLQFHFFCWMPHLIHLSVWPLASGEMAGVGADS